MIGLNELDGSSRANLAASTPDVPADETVSV